MCFFLVLSTWQGSLIAGIRGERNHGFFFHEKIDKCARLIAVGGECQKARGVDITKQCVVNYSRLFRLIDCWCGRARL